MFETDLSELSTADLLESAAEHRAIANQADARLLQHAQIYADRFHPSVCSIRPGRRSADGRERAVVLGGDGCPEIAEFAIAEFGVMLGISPMVARQFLGEALALRHRFPFTWARVLAGDATPWKARQLATQCLKLPEQAARSVDQRVAPLIDSITPYRLDKIIRAAKTHADPDLAHDEATEAAGERGVFIGRSDHHGNKTIYAKAPAAAVIRHDATIAAIAEALKTFGDTRQVQHRRADAIGIIADPRFTQELLTQARNHPTPTTTSANPSTTTSTTTSKATSTTTAASPAHTTSSASSPAASPAHTTGSASSPARQPANTTTSEAAPGPRRVDAASQSAAGTRSPATGQSTPSPRDTATGHNAPGHNAPNPGDTATGHSASSPRDTATGHNAPGPRDTATGSSASAPRDTAPGRNPLGPRDRSNDTPCTSVDPARSGSTALPASSPYGGPRDPSNDTPCTSANPTHSDTTADPASPASERGHAGDANPADPIELREAPPDDDVGPYDPDPPSDPFDTRPMGYVPGPRTEPDDSVPMDGAAQRALDARLAQIKHDAHTHPTSSGGQVRPGQTEVYVHLTDLTLATGNGVLRAEGIGPLLADQLTELIGHAPYTVKPVIDLNDAVSVDAYEIPARIRERVRLTHPVELFPYGTRETHPSIDLDHIEPYDPSGPAGQTSTRNLAPLSRFAHRVKTHARGWTVRRVNTKTLEWTTPHGFTFHVDPTGTHRQPNTTTNS
ncbi:hypothetical protein [Kribbella pratensis]|uniref:DUF222 domain-containing protein n=1 Tax=Kribbella pratensis TaxID=2512112 RepID=A0A4R8C7T7_9ACTN|nr:hypothetical protein [Kribbella pratensis]TDW69443.1 hypothetical protein EV653_3467 [Kribbella pratensis]